MTQEEKEAEFVPNIINSTVYLICMGLQVSTFAVNYKGHPFMESLRENRLLMYSILASSGVVLCLALNLVPDLQSAFQIVDFPDDVSIKSLFWFHTLFYCIFQKSNCSSEEFSSSCFWLTLFQHFWLIKYVHSYLGIIAEKLKSLTIR